MPSDTLSSSLFVRLGSDWVHRRVDHVEISAATGVVQRLLSIDFAVPAELAAHYPSGTQVPVPLTYLRRAGLVDFTITDAHGAAVPVLAEGAETAHLHPPLTGLMTGLLAAASPGAADGTALVHRCPDHQDRLDHCLAAALEQTVAVAHRRDLTDPLRPDGADIRSVFTALARTANALLPVDALWSPSGAPIRLVVKLAARVAPVDADRMSLRIVWTTVLTALAALVRGPGRGPIAARSRSRWPAICAR